jgi:Purple acid Phosphatase, N-terminal domain
MKKGGSLMKRKRLFLNLWLMLAACVLLRSIPATAQVSPTVKKTDHVQIRKGPALERNDSYLTIITWTSNNPGGSPEHYGVVHYGRSPNSLTETAKSPIRLNPTHDYTVFRVRMDALKPRTTYYYTVDSMEVNGKSDGVKSSVKHFATP